MVRMETSKKAYPIYFQEHRLLIHQSLVITVFLANRVVIVIIIIITISIIIILDHHHYDDLYSGALLLKN